MRILVTGACGFIGSHLVDYFLARGHDVVALDRIDETASLGWLPKEVPMVWHDLRAPIGTGFGVGQLSKPFDWVCHLAAASHVDRSVRDPVSFLMDNCIGTANLLEWARKANPGKFLYFSTDEVFGPAKTWSSYPPQARHRPTNPYAASKAAAEALVSTWSSTYGMRIAVSHCTNVYGPRQHPEKLIPLAIRTILQGGTIQVHSRDGRPARRFYVHVLDVCRAVDAIMSRGSVVADGRSGRYNISGDAEVTVSDVVERIGEALGKQPRVELVEDPPGRPRPDMRYSVDDTETRALGWSPIVSFVSGLYETVEWYKTYAPEWSQA